MTSKVDQPLDQRDTKNSLPGTRPQTGVDRVRFSSDQPDRATILLDCQGDRSVGRCPVLDDVGAAPQLSGLGSSPALPTRHRSSRSIHSRIRSWTLAISVLRRRYEPHFDSTHVRAISDTMQRPMPDYLASRWGPSAARRAACSGRFWAVDTERLPDWRLRCLVLEIAGWSADRPALSGCRYRSGALATGTYATVRVAGSIWRLTALQSPAGVVYVSHTAIAGASPRALSVAEDEVRPSE